MSESMMPVSTDALQYRNLLFHLNKPVNMTVELFNTVWPCIDSVYTKLRSGSLQAYSKVHVETCECRLRKTKKLKTACDATASNNKVIKQRCSGIRDSYVCNVRIKVSHFVDNIAVIVE